MSDDKHAVLRIADWTYECGEPQCCSDYGTNLYVNDALISEHFEGDIEEIGEILKIFGITSEYVYDNEY